jgi:hypothetical protein
MNGWHREKGSVLLLSLATVLPCLLLARAVRAEAPAPRSVGFLGDGSGWFRDCAPPTEWSENNNILWKTPLPNWSNSSPIAIGSRIFVTCEGGWQGVWPMLLCLDAATGKVLWQRELDHLDQLPDGRGAKVREAWQEYRTFVRDALRRQYACQYEGKADEAAAWWKEHRCQGQIQAAKGNPGVMSAFGRAKNDPPFAAVEETVKQAGLGIEDCYGWCTYIGRAFPTPVSDGRRVYAVTGFNAVFCFDMGGQLVWKKWFGLPETKDQGYKSVHAWFTHSPLLIGERLVTTVDHVARCFEASTGKPLWESRYLDLSDPVYRNPKHCHSVKYAAGSPRHLALEGTDVLIVSPGQVVRLSDGKLLAPNTKMASMCPCGSTHDGQSVTYCFTWENYKGHYPDSPVRKKDIQIADYGLAAVGLALEGADAAKTKVVFSLPLKTGLATGGLVYRDGLLFGSLEGQLKVWDARTGAEVKSVPTGVGKPHHIVAAGDYVYVLDKTGKCAVLKCDKTAQRVAVNTLSPAPHEGEKLEQRACQSAAKDWGAYPFTASMPFFEGSRMYIRSHDFLYCIGK